LKKFKIRVIYKLLVIFLVLLLWLTTGNFLYVEDSEAITTEIVTPESVDIENGIWFFSGRISLLIELKSLVRSTVSVF
jgi:hypothetical protein